MLMFVSVFERAKKTPDHVNAFLTSDFRNFDSWGDGGSQRTMVAVDVGRFFCTGRNKMFSIMVSFAHERANVTCCYH